MSWLNSRSERAIYAHRAKQRPGQAPVTLCKGQPLTGGWTLDPGPLLPPCPHCEARFKKLLTTV